MNERQVDKQVVFTGKKVRLELHHVREEDGRKHTREVVVHPGAVVILPILPDGRILLIRNYRATVGEYLIELPAGTLEPGESPMNCAGRELVEETNFAAGKLTWLASFYSSPGILTEKLHAFVATKLTPEQGTPDVGEHIQPHPLTFDEAMDAVQHGQITDGKTIATLLYYEKFGEKSGEKK